MTLQISIKFRGVINIDKVVPEIKQRCYDFVKEQKLGFFLSYVDGDFQFHAVDRFASFPLFYCVRDGRPIVSENIDELLPHIPAIIFDPIGFYTIGGLLHGERTASTPYKGIYRILPGHYIEYDRGKIMQQRYWSFRDLENRPFSGSYDEACEELGFLIKQAVSRCLDFAPDAALHMTGGLDSGTVAALACQLSPNVRQSFNHCSEGAPLDGMAYESGFIRAYQRVYPNLKIETFRNSDFPQTYFSESTNWHGLSEEEPYSHISNMAAKLGKKYILTGLGGDELASTCRTWPSNKCKISTDRQAKFFHRTRKPRLKRKLKALLLPKAKDRFFLKLHDDLNNHSKWYTSSFQAEVEPLFSKPAMYPAMYPTSYHYNLEILSRSWFTVRSDMWNFIGKRQEIDYLHPLLDNDLVDHCASLPVDFYALDSTRKMFKQAVRKYVPEELLTGTKRPSFLKEEQVLTPENFSWNIKKQKSQLELLRETFASTVYDYENSCLLLDKISALSMSNNQLNKYHGVIYYAVYLNNILIKKSNYINKFFSN